MIGTIVGGTGFVFHDSKRMTMTLIGFGPLYELIHISNAGCG